MVYQDQAVPDRNIIQRSTIEKGDIQVIHIRKHYRAYSSRSQHMNDPCPNIWNISSPNDELGPEESDVDGTLNLLSPPAIW
jgi:hypothetical protein